MIALLTILFMVVSAIKFPAWLYVMVFLSGLRIARK